MLCVDKEYRKKGLGTILLNQSEKYILDNGYDKVNIGVGFDYLMPGVPINDENMHFFKRRFYIHSWNNDECFDMDMELKDTICDYNIGDTIKGITYRLATINDIEEIQKCTLDAEQSFTEYYMDRNLYNIDNNQIVLVAEDNGEICGTLMISKETEAPNMGSVGCTTTKHNHRGRGIATTMVQIGTKYLKDLGYKYGHLGYTYTGLDKMYGKAGYKVTTKYFMAEKALTKIKDSDFTFRKLRKEEFERLKHLFNNTDELWTKYKDMRMKQYNENDVDIYIVELNDQIVGEVTINYSSHALPTEAIPNQRVYIQAFRIEPSYQGYGLGQKLMDYVLLDLENKGIREFTIGVEDDNEIAKHIYFKYGFTEAIDHGKGDTFDPVEYTLYMKTLPKENKIKKVVLSLLIIISIFMIIGCNSPKEEISNDEQANINSNEVVKSVKAIINNQEYTIYLEDNKTVMKFVDMLPRELTMNELNGNEKYIYLDTTFPTNSSNPQTINAGDVMLYGNNCLVIFYKSFDTSYSYTKIGHIDNLPDLGNGSISIKFEK